MRQGIDNPTTAGMVSKNLNICAINLLQNKRKWTNKGNDVSYIVFHNLNTQDIHHMQLSAINSESLQRVRDYSAEILYTNVEYHRILIDVSKVRILPIPVLANEIRQVAFENDASKASIAIVVDSQEYTAKLAEIIKTILERDSVELFTDVSKAKLWLELENRRYLKRHIRSC